MGLLVPRYKEVEWGIRTVANRVGNKSWFTLTRAITNVRYLSCAPRDRVVINRCVYHLKIYIRIDYRVFVKK